MTTMENDVLMQPAVTQSILVVDDDEQVCEFLAEALTFLGHRVVTAENGEEALKLLRNDRFSIVIADMDMPVMDGMELIQHIVSDIKNAPAIIAITGHSMQYKYTDVVAAGAVDFITKPFTLDELEAKVNRIIRERTLLKELERLAVRDHLTGLYNRRYFHKVVKREVIRALRYDSSIFLLYIDIDHFKEYNDRHGHNAGDSLLVMLADILSSSIRDQVDSAFRFGGDEFTVLVTSLNGSDQAAVDQALKVAYRIRTKYNRQGLHPTSLSIGMALFQNKTDSIDEDIRNMIHRADCALYYVKNQLGGDSIHYDGAQQVSARPPDAVRSSLGSS
ncbi:GGDEF domain-containing response regulator [Desulfoferrobacter suflitae]|uniref:GGDEF domain-containing response regulator n=1 Tax=Desulfoferrobacter suflitae TaxID=2865782 RepID=UPI0021645E23|nr:diguanylate cyclase [Desulfoferrobacter suflitae]MCK8602895.1 diguanylate cyclase [Desulfoferrobacter suflitae]